MVNKTCPYRTRCSDAISCYAITSKEETWCFNAKGFWDRDHQEEIRDYWRNPVGFKKHIGANVEEE